MVTKKQFDEAVAVIQEYVGQRKAVKQTSEVGCRVELSGFGRKMQNHYLKGVVVGYIPFNGSTDGTVMVLWDGRKRPVSMHVSHVSKISKSQ